MIWRNSLYTTSIPLFFSARKAKAVWMPGMRTSICSKASSFKTHLGSPCQSQTLRLQPVRSELLAASSSWRAHHVSSSASNPGRTRWNKVLCLCHLFASLQAKRSFEKTCRDSSWEDQSFSMHALWAAFWPEISLGHTCIRCSWGKKTLRLRHVQSQIGTKIRTTTSHENSS